MESIGKGGAVPPQVDAEAVHVRDEATPCKAVSDFFQALPERHLDGGYLHPHQFHRAWEPLASEIENRAHRYGLPESISINLTTIENHLEADPTVESTPMGQKRLEYLIESTARFLVEVYRNSLCMEAEFGVLREIRCTDGDPHKGKRPCFLTFIKYQAPRTLMQSVVAAFTPRMFAKHEEYRFVYKPRNMVIEEATLSPGIGLFSSLNALCIERGLFTEPPLRTRTIINHGTFGFHEFVRGEYLDPSIRGIYYSSSNFGEKLCTPENFEQTEAFSRYIFLEEVIKICGVGQDAHIGNFIFNGEELYTEPIDLEVFSPTERDLSIMPGIHSIVRSHKPEEYKKLDPFIEAERARFRSFLMEDGNEAIETFRRSILEAPNPHIRFVPVSTSLFKQLLAIASDEEEYYNMVSDDLKKNFTRLGFNFFPSETFKDNLKHTYNERNIPIFQSSPDGREIYYEGELIARKIES